MTDKRLISKIYTTQYQRVNPIKKWAKNKQTNKKMGRRPKQTFFQRRCTDGQQAYEKMLNIANYQRNTNETNNEMSPHTCQNGYYQKVYK